MSWTSTAKWLNVSSKVAHANVQPGITGRATEIDDLTFGLWELALAMARCSYLYPISPKAVTHESQMMATLIAQHVDEVGSDFLLTGKVDKMKDFVKSGFAGSVASGLAYLAMVRDGYIWADHFENVGVGHPGVKKRPDFVFASMKHGVALVEAKGTRGSSSASFNRTIGRGYTDQVEPHLGYIANGQLATHGYCVGARLHSKKTDLRVHHTLTSKRGVTVDEGIDGGQGNIGTVAEGAELPSQGDLPSFAARTIATVQRHNYATALSLIHSVELGKALREGERPVDVDFMAVNWRGRTWLASPRLPGILDSGATLQSQELTQTFVPEHFFAIEASIARRVFSHFVFDAPHHLVAHPMVDPPVEEYRTLSGQEENDGAILPDGMAIISREALRSEPWPTSLRRGPLGLGETFEAAHHMIASKHRVTVEVKDASSKIDAPAVQLLLGVRTSE